MPRSLDRPACCHRLGCLETCLQLLFGSEPIDLRRSNRVPAFFPELMCKPRNVLVIENVHVPLLHSESKRPGCSCRAVTDGKPRRGDTKLL